MEWRSLAIPCNSSISAGDKSPSSPFCYIVGVIEIDNHD